MDGGEPSMEIQLARAKFEALQHEMSAAYLTITVMQYRIPEIQAMLGRLQDEIKALGGNNGPAGN